MARGIKVLDIISLPDGGKEVTYSWGPSTTPPAGGTGSMTFGSEDQLREFVRSFEDSMDEFRMLALHLAITYLGADGSFKNVTQVKNKTLQVDVFAPTPLKVV